MQRIQLNNQCWVDTGKRTPNHYDYEAIRQHIPDVEQPFMCYGRMCYPKRRTISFGTDYTYSGQTKIGHPFPDVLLPYLNMANEYATAMNFPAFNQCLANWYPNGDAYMSKHSDDETQLYHEDGARDIVVYGVSLTQGMGKDRKFRFREKGVKGIKLDLEAGHGDIIVMGGLTQEYYTHEIPKCKTNKGRISLTFRTFVS